MRLLAVLLVVAGPAFGQSLSSDDGETRLVIDTPVARYGHNIMGDVPEWSRLCLSRDGLRACATLPDSSVFEDMEPRLADIDSDGAAEAVVVESDARLGAALVIYDLQDGTLNRTATPNIGQSFRWLAPLGVADFNGDGAMDVAYVDRPHLAKLLRIWTYRDGGLTELATLSGVTNHAIGEAFITSAIRDCGDLPEMILTDGARRNVISIRFKDDRLDATPIRPFTGPAAITDAAAC